VFRPCYPVSFLHGTPHHKLQITQYTVWGSPCVTAQK
jgi:hypothetical protein